MPVGIGPRGFLLQPEARGFGRKNPKETVRWPYHGIVGCLYTNLKREWERPPFWCFGHLINTSGPRRAGCTSDVLCSAAQDTRSDHGRSLASGMGPRDAYGCVPPGGDGRRAGGGEILQRPKMSVRSKRKESDRRAEDRPTVRLCARVCVRQCARPARTLRRLACTTQWCARLRALFRDSVLLPAAHHADSSRSVACSHEMQSRASSSE